MIAEKMTLKPFIAGKYMTQASGFDMEYLKQALKDCADADYSFKSGKMTDQMSVELLIVNYSKKYMELSVLLLSESIDRQKKPDQLLQKLIHFQNMKAYTYI